MRRAQLQTIRDPPARLLRAIWAKITEAERPPHMPAQQSVQPDVVVLTHYRTVLVPDHDTPPGNGELECQCRPLEMEVDISILPTYISSDFYTIS